MSELVELIWCTSTASTFNPLFMLSTTGYSYNCDSFPPTISLNAVVSEFTNPSGMLLRMISTPLR